MIPVLFNRWLDPVCDFGGVPIDHLVPQLSAWNRTADLFADVGGTGREVSPVEQVFTDYLIDVVSFHPYYMWNLDPSRQPLAARGEFERHLDACTAIAAAAGKELLATETVWGARDDATHVEVMRYTLGALVQRNIGFTVHALHHSLVSDLHRDAYGPVGLPECLHFIEADGQLRGGHEAFNEFAPSAR